MLYNNYFKISSIEGGDEIWSNNRLMYEYDIIPERVYEYTTVNYGNYEIMYCVTRPSRLGIEETFIETPEGMYENCFKYEKKRSYVTLFRICCFLFLPLVCIFGYGYWGRCKKDKKSLENNL